MMPISPQNRGRYPPNWKEIRAAILKRAGHRCEGSPAHPECRAANYEPHPDTGSLVVLTIAHLDHPGKQRTGEPRRLVPALPPRVRRHASSDQRLEDAAGAAGKRGNVRDGGGLNMIALSIRQTWAWHILNSGKDIENRNWNTSVRGRVLIHASKGCTRAAYEAGKDPLWASKGPTIELPPLERLERGGIVGSVEIVDCVAASDSPWFCGRFGFVLRDPRLLPYVPWKGQLGFFEVPESALHSDAALTAGQRPSPVQRQVRRQR